MADNFLMPAVNAQDELQTDNRIVLKASSIWKLFRQGRQSTAVLKGIDLVVYEGEIISIVGPSGAGKSTFLHIAGLIDSMSQGELFLFGKSTKTFSEKDKTILRNNAIGFLFQFHYLLEEFTVLENVMMPALMAGESWQRAREKSEEMLVKVGLQDKLGSLPAEISGGEQQRAALARALINHPKLILADEPTGNLDNEKGEEIRQLLWSKAEESKATLLVITHNMELAKKAHKVVKMVDGKFVDIVASNPKQAVFFEETTVPSRRES